jgi:predicted metal-dependent hydrolase
MKAPANTDNRSIKLGGQQLEYRLTPSKTARHLRLRVGMRGIEVVHPLECQDREIANFLRVNEKWLINQVKRVERFSAVRKPVHKKGAEIFYRGERVPVIMREAPDWQGANQVFIEGNSIVIIKGRKSQTAPKKSLENWLRKQARIEIERQLEPVTRKLKRFPNQVYIKGQRTKWGNCSAKQNLSFNWRLIMAPDHVMKYLVVHESVHLAVPDHSQKFWLTVRSLCPEMEKAKQWLCVHGERLQSELDSL